MEIAACRRLRDPFPAYAIRFAAKEALLKALGTGLVGRMSWRDIEVVDEARGARLQLTGETRSAAARLGVGRVHLSTARAADHAAASVVLESITVSADG
jgi:holo-[acyl-carrier protein] synthase